MRIFAVLYLLLFIGLIHPSSAQNPAGGFHIAGSDTVNAELMPALVEAYITGIPGSQYVAEPPTAQGLLIRFMQHGKLRQQIHISSSGSLSGFNALLSGTADLAVASDRYTPAELAQFERTTGINLRAPGKEHVIALDSVVIVINRANPLFGRIFPIEEIANIFAGRITDWSQIGGARAPITVYARNEQSGTSRFFSEHVLQPFGFSFGAGTVRPGSSAEVRDAVQRDVNAIGFIGGTHVGLSNHAVTLRSRCGLAHRPDEFSVQTEAYPLSRRIYLYQPRGLDNPDGRAFLNFLLNESRARGVIYNSGFIDQVTYFELPEQERFWLKTSLEPVTPRLPASGMAVRNALMSLLGKTRRLSVNLRFETAKDVLDTKALADLQRIVQFLRGPVAEGKTVYLVGFADSRGGWDYNYDLALRRAKQVAQALQLLGIPVKAENVLSGGWLAPVACEDTETGLYHNRRVEVWMAGEDARFTTR